MAGIADRLESLLSMYRDRLLPMGEKSAGNPATDLKGRSASSCASSLRFIGVAEFKLTGNVQSFRDRLGKAASYILGMFQRAAAGEPISKSYLTMLRYQSVFDALAAGDFGLAGQLASVMGGRPELDRDIHSFDCAMGYALRAVVLNDREQMQDRIGRLVTELGKKGNGSFHGYGVVYQAILGGDLQMANSGLAEVVEGHKKASRNGVFAGTEDEVLCVWGIGLANLCRRNGLPVQGIPPLLPDELLV